MALILSLAMRMLHQGLLVNLALMGSQKSCMAAAQLDHTSRAEAVESQLSVGSSRRIACLGSSTFVDMDSQRPQGLW